MDKIETLDKFTCPFGGQEVELQQFEYETGGMPLLRLRIRERGARLTVFDVDPRTAARGARAVEPTGSSAPAASAERDRKMRVRAIKRAVPGIGRPRGKASRLNISSKPKSKTKQLRSPQRRKDAKRIKNKALPD